MTAKPGINKKSENPVESSSAARRFFGVFRYSKRALELVWATSPKLTFLLGFVTLLAGALPSAVAWIGARIVDSVIAATRHYQDTGVFDATTVVGWVLAEAVVMVAITAAHRGITLCQALFKAQLSHRVNVMILEKALTLELEHFENSEFYDKLTRARREASSRPLSLVNRTFSLAQNAVSLVSYALLLYHFSPWAVLILLFAGFPSFFAEAKFAGDAFRLFRWRSPESRRQMYLETVLAREDHAKEVKLFRLAPTFLQR
jgi:ATP-binding cassette subfamily B protein